MEVVSVLFRRYLAQLVEERQLLNLKAFKVKAIAPAGADPIKNLDFDSKLKFDQSNQSCDHF